MSKLPQHVAIIMDGNGRWAKQRRLPRFMGHRAGAKVVRGTVKFCIREHIEHLTLFALSVENFLSRPRKEISLLIRLFSEMLRKNIQEMHQEGIRLTVKGDISVLPQVLIEEIEQAITLTSANTKLNFNLAVNYSGRWDIAQAAQKLALQGGASISATDASEQLAGFLQFSDTPDPDLLIRTGGEQRISNFMLWQCAYSEIFFSKVFWPDFDDQEFTRALQFYQGRERRFGKILEQAIDVNA